jgi:uridine kinase
MPVTGSTKPSRNCFSKVIGIAGGSGSGKTYFAKALKEELNRKSQICEIIYQDSYYIDQSAKFDFDGGSVNFDHPTSLDFDLLAQQLRSLKSGLSIEVPIYSFLTHSRKPETEKVDPLPIVLVDGILIFHPLHLREIFDERIFFETPESLRFQRRLERDVVERGRTEEGVRQQFARQVKPMHDQFVEPTKAFADTIVRDVDEFDSILSQIVSKLTKRI